MGLRTGGCYAKVWKVDRREKFTKIQASISKKDKTTGQYETDWNGFINLVGPAQAEAANLKEGDRIKILEFEVTTNYNKEKNVTYTNYAVFKYENANGEQQTQQASKAPDTAVEGDADSLPF